MIYSSTDADWTNEQTGYLGAGAVTFTLNAGAGVLANGVVNGNLTFPTSGLSGTIDALTDGVHIQYTCTYNQSPTGAPEPVTMVLAASGLLALVLARKRRAR